MRRAAKRDDNEGAIIDALRDVGCRVTQLSGAGVPDLLVGRRGVTYLLEVKDPTKPKRDQRLTEPQVQWHGEWAGVGGPCVIVRTIEEALRAVGCVWSSSGVRP